MGEIRIEPFCLKLVEENQEIKGNIWIVEKQIHLFKDDFFSKLEGIKKCCQSLRLNQITKREFIHITRIIIFSDFLPNYQDLHEELSICTASIQSLSRVKKINPTFARILERMVREIIF